MKPIEQYQEEVGYTDCLEQKVKSIETWVAYSEGKVINCLTREEAARYSKMYERVISNKTEVEEWRKKCHELEVKAEQLWTAGLILEAQNGYGLPQLVAEKVFAKAWSDGHAYGYNEVQNIFENECEYAVSIISAYQRGSEYQCM